MLTVQGAWAVTRPANAAKTSNPSANIATSPPGEPRPPHAPGVRRAARIAGQARLAVSR
jgi:hypothetical protein